MGIQSSKNRLKKFREKKISYGNNRSNSSNSIDRIGSNNSSENIYNNSSDGGDVVLIKGLSIDNMINDTEIYLIYARHDFLRETWKGNFSSPIKKDLER